MEVIFYKNCSYKMLQKKFNAAWTNLYFSLHHSGHILWKEGADPFDENTIFGDPNISNEIAFTLTDNTLAETAINLLSDSYGGEAVVMRGDGSSIESKESLAYCNNPFRLPLNKFTYGEFKRRFTNRWTNLSIKLYDVAPRTDNLPCDDRELAEDFEMSSLNHADRAFLHDYIFIATWDGFLANVCVAAVIRNDKLDIECEGNMKNLRLKDLDKAENLEAVKKLSLWRFYGD